MSTRKDLPDGLPEDTIEKVFREELERHSNTLIDEIKDFLNKPPSEQVTEASAEVFPDQYCDGYTGIGLYLKDKTTKHYPFAKFVRDLPYVDVDIYMEEDIYVPDMVVDLVKTWFSECWFKAGGWDFPLPLEIIGHDGFGNGRAIKLTKSS